LTHEYAYLIASRKDTKIEGKKEEEKCENVRNYKHSTIPQDKYRINVKWRRETKMSTEGRGLW